MIGSEFVALFESLARGSGGSSATTINPEEHALEEPLASLRIGSEGLQRMLLSPLNELCALARGGGVCDDMNQPLSEYYIATSHNSYLTGDQYRSRSHRRMYKHLLLSGCRCVEVDCWDGIDGEPEVKHGWTLTQPIRFVQVSHCIARYAFEASPYPLIISLEVHCSLAQQRKMANIMREVFGPALLLPNDRMHSTLEARSQPSPKELRGRILLKGHTATDQGHTGIEQGYTGTEEGHAGTKEGHTVTEQGHIVTEQNLETSVGEARASMAHVLQVTHAPSNSPQSTPPPLTKPSPPTPPLFQVSTPRPKMPRTDPAATARNYWQPCATAAVPFNSSLPRCASTAAKTAATAATAAAMTAATSAATSAARKSVRSLEYTSGCVRPGLINEAADALLMRVTRPQASTGKRAVAPELSGTSTPIPLPFITLSLSPYATPPFPPQR